MAPNNNNKMVKSLPFRKCYTAPAIEDSDSGYSSPADNESQHLLDLMNNSSPELTNLIQEDPVVTEARMIAQDILNSECPKYDGAKIANTTWHLGGQSSYQSPRSATVLRLVHQLLEKHEILYKSMVDRLHLTSRTNIQYLDQMCDEVFADGQVTWGKILALYALCAAIGRHFRDSEKQDVARESVECIGQYIGKKVTSWIKKEGGWVAIEEAFPPEDHVEKRIWKGLLYTGIGLGVLASVINCVR